MKSNFLSYKIIKPYNLILGCAPLAGLYTQVEYSDAKDTIKTAINLGWNGLDTAPSYGLGKSEEIIGKVLSEMEQNNELRSYKGYFNINIYTKVGRLLQKSNQSNEYTSNEKDISSPLMFGQLDSNYELMFDYTEEGIRKSYYDSLKRLKYNINGIRLHDAETMDRYNDVLKYKSINSMIKLKSEGKVRLISLGMNDAHMVLKILYSHPEVEFDNILIAGCWNLLDQSGYELLLECEKRNITVINAGIFGSGLLWGGDTFRYSKASKENLNKVRSWKKLANKYNQSLPAIALAFAFLPTIIKFVCIGARTSSEVKNNHSLINAKVPFILWLDAINEGLLPSYLKQHIAAEIETFKLSKL